MPSRPNDSVTEIDVHVGSMIRAIRKERGISQETLAEALGVTFQQIQKYELGRNRISASKMFAASELLAVSPGAFFEGIKASDTSPSIMGAFFMEDGAKEVAEGFLKLSQTQRRAVVALIASMTE